jgi:astacin
LLVGQAEEGSGDDGRHLLKLDAQSEETEDEDTPQVSETLLSKARRFGQTDEEWTKVQETMRKLDMLVKSKLKMANNDAETKDDGSEPRRVISMKDRQQDFVPKSIAFYEQVQTGKKLAGRFKDSDTRMFHSPEELGPHFEGDIVLTGEQAEELYEAVAHGDDVRHKRKFVATGARRWNVNRPIEYSFDGSHSPKEQKVIELALQHWSNVTCLNFYRRDDPPRGSRIVFTDVDGCASNVGRNPSNEPQFVSLSSECLRLGVIAHEVAHALGFWHEQSRPDRDKFVDVLWRNIDGDSLGQFLKEKNHDVDTLGIPYDYGSIMHYRSKAFAKTDSLYTLLTNTRDYQRTIGQRDQLSFNDIRLMNKAYCSKRCSSPLACQRGGYTDTRHCDKCRCPDGFTGKLCDKVMGGYGSGCGGTVEVEGDWKTISSPNYPRRFDEGQECSWLIKAPSGQHVELEFVGQFDLYCKKEHSLCMDYVEVKNSTDFANTGMRYCCDQTPSGTISSVSEDMLVLFRSFYRSTTGFKARVRASSSNRRS